MHEHQTIKLLLTTRTEADPVTELLSNTRYARVINMHGPSPMHARLPPGAPTAHSGCTHVLALIRSCHRSVCMSVQNLDAGLPTARPTISATCHNTATTKCYVVNLLTSQWYWNYPMSKVRTGRQERQSDAP